jgi:bifunctional UDP-N-acetylglucosamine pyrophosphorylase/glucosamine-1-phosphate N-acetyltransferase
VTDTAPTAVVVLAAGQGTRMKSALAKVLHAICGRSLLGHVLAAVEPLTPDTTLVVVGHDRDQVIDALTESAPGAQPVVQAEQRGTGNAVRIALDATPDLRDGTVLVLPGDAPLITEITLRELLERHQVSRAAATWPSASRTTRPYPVGSGISAVSRVAAIVEHNDADAVTRELREVGTSIYVFDVALLRDALARITTDNAAGEEYLTDVVALLVSEGAVVTSHLATDHRETMGVNDRVQLAEARRLMRDRIVRHWMLEGATITDPQTTWMGVNVRLEPDCVIHQNTQLHGHTAVGSFAVVGPDTSLTNCSVGEHATVLRSQCQDAQIGPHATVGPYSYLRPGTRLARGVKVGTFVETKNADLGADTKVPHLSYVGDATVGERSNIGAATIFVNFDGVDKHATVIGDDVRVGSDTMIVAPRTIGDGAYTAAGSVITEDVPPGALGVARSRQRNVEGWSERRRPGTPSAEAARRAREGATMEPTSPSDGDDQGAPL